MMRAVFFLLLLAGAGVAFGYPWFVQNLADYDLGVWRVQDAASGFRPAEANLTSSDAPVKAMVDMTAVVPAGTDGGQSVLTITAATEGRTVLARTLSLDSAERREDSPQTLQQVYRLDAGTIADVAGGAYIFTVGPGDADGVNLFSVDLRLSGGGGDADPRAAPVGFSIMAIGFIGFVLTFRRGRSDDGGAGNAPPKPRWGRGAQP